MASDALKCKLSLLRFVGVCIICAWNWLPPLFGQSPAQAVPVQIESHSQTKHPATVADSINSTITMLDDYRYPTGVYGSGSLAVFSPDEKKFVIVLRKGDVERNLNEYSILLFQTSEVFHSPQPDVLLTMTSSSNREAIANLTWLDDSETLAFLAEHPTELRQLYTFNTRTGALQKRTNETANILSYSMTPNADQFAYVVEDPVRTVFDQKTNREGFLVSTESAYDVVRAENGGLHGNAQLWFQSNADRRRQIKISDRISEWS